MPNTQKPNASSYCIALQPICDADMVHVADELLYRATAGARSAVIEDGLTATARACNAVFYEAGIESICGRRKLFLNAPREWLLNPALLPPSPEQVVIEVLESVEGDEDVLAALRHIKSQGYTIALDDFVLTDATRPLLDLADIVKLDMQEQPPTRKQVEHYLALGISLLAEKVETKEEFDQTRAMGFTLFQGYFYARPETRQTTKLNRRRNQSAQLRLLGELQKPEADYDKLERLLVQDPQLGVQMLRLVNSAHHNVKQEIVSLRQALGLLGLNRLLNLVTMLVLANDDPCNMLLLPQALTRAAMCARLAARDCKENKEPAFMVGLLSMVDVLLGQKLELLCDQLPLTQEVRRALLAHEGPLGKSLHLVKAFEKGRLINASDEAVAKLNQYFLESRSWANHVLDGMDN
ncbi:EAL and HDOD domain-containing protein [Marinobacter sp. ELB17]|uniref:EAL and HDOD domain-containing protein n=1 Tax=Marinobacter sp. ELB17 TaxID=270374 RepID=UPI0000F38EB1|nr:HDOD domain-containing protein [Marinobacter sp. ELB17]EBA01188.1 diguanylate phosphodiesterase (EAL domain) [Marinobacter sp. ELB17]